MKFIKSVQLFLVAILIIGLALPNSTQAAVRSGDLMQINKTVSNNTVVKGETTDVTMTVKGTPKDSTFVKPNDVVLIIDKSGSMSSDNRMAAAKTAAKEFIDLMDLTKHELGIVDFESSVYSFPLTTDKTAAKAYVDTIQLGGGTNTGDAIRQATAMLANKRPNAQPTIVIMTDGAANSDVDAKAASKAAKDAGITFYSIALLASYENPDTSKPNLLLKEMASSFDHHHFVLGSVGLSDVYKAIVEEIGLASAYNVTITDTISPEFELVPGSYDHHIPKPTVTGNTIEWFISELKSNELSFTYQVRAKDNATAGKYPVAQTATTFEMGDSSTYSMNTANPIVEIKNHAPVITNITENTGIITGGETVTITGQNFLPSAKVYFGSKLATIISETGTQIVVTTPTGSQGPVEVKVQNTDGQFAVGDFSYYADPTLTSVSPAEGPMEGGNKVSVYGSNFMRGATVYINDVEATTTFVTAVRLDVIVPSATESGTVSVKVINPDKTSAELLNAYKYLTPPPPPVIELHSVSITSGELIGGESTFLFGKNFDRNVKVYFGDNEATVTTYTSADRITVLVPPGTTEGVVTVKVVNPSNSSAELVDAYTYLAPPPPPVIQLDSISNATGKLEGGELTYLYGQNFDPNVKVYFGDNEATVTTFTSASRIRVSIPKGDTTGVVTVKVVNPDNSSAELIDAYEYLAPPPLPPVELVSLGSKSGDVSGGAIIYVNGKNFDPEIKIYFGTEEANLHSYLSATRVRVYVPTAVTAGFVSVTAENPDGSTSVLTDAYEYTTPPPLPAPEITSLSDTSILTNQTKTIYLYGKNFTADSKVYFGNTEVAISFLSSTRLRFSIPTSNIPLTVDVKLVNPDGQVSVLQDAFTYTEPVLDPAPVIASLSSTSGLVTGGDTLTITGQNFKKGAKVFFGDKAGTIVSVNDTEIVVRTNASALSGFVPVKVVNPDSQEVILIDGYHFDPLQATITSLSATSGPSKGGNLVYIYGTNFNNSMSVTVDGQQVAYTYYATNRIRISMPSGSPGSTVAITVDTAGVPASINYTYK